MIVTQTGVTLEERIQTIPGLSLAWMLSNFINPAVRSSLSRLNSKIAAKLPFTIFGDIGEFARSKLDPNSAFLSLVSRISRKHYQNV